MPVGPGDSPDVEAFAGGGRGMLPLAPCVDGDLIPCDPLDAVRAGAGTSCDLLTGTTTEEFNMVFALSGSAVDDDAALRALERTGLSPDEAKAYRGARPNATGTELLGQALTDRMFRVPTEGLCDAAQAPRAVRTTIQFAWRSPALGELLRRGPLRGHPLCVRQSGRAGRGGHSRARTAPGSRRSHAPGLGGLRERGRSRLALLHARRSPHHGLRRRERGGRRPPAPPAFPVGGLLNVPPEPTGLVGLPVEVDAIRARRAQQRPVDETTQAVQVLVERRRYVRIRSPSRSSSASSKANSPVNAASPSSALNSSSIARPAACCARR